jgi:hypothetical protein
MKAKLARHLASLCDRTRLEVPAGRVLVPARPIDLIEAASALADPPVRERLAWAGFAAHAEDAWGAEAWRPLVTFTWDEPGGAWSFGLIRLRLGGTVDLVATPLDHDGTPEMAVAALDPEASPDLVAAFLVDAAGSNGSEYGFALFGELPPRVEDHVGLPEGTLDRVHDRWVRSQVRRPFR